MKLFSKIGTYLGILSIVGFVSIILLETNTLPMVLDYEKAIWFFVMGIALMVMGGVKTIYKVFEDGRLSESEINRLLAVVVGGMSFIIGFMALFSVESNVASGVKVIISALAIVIISIETFFNR